MSRRKSITKRRRDMFLQSLSVSGSVTRATKGTQIARQSWYLLAKRDPEFKQEWDDAELEFLDKLESEAIRRATLGVVEGIPYLQTSVETVEVEGKDGKRIKKPVEIKQTKIRDVTHYSDRLMALVLQARHPSYKPTKVIELPGGPLTPAIDRPDYSNLNDKEMQAWTHLQRKLHGVTERDT